MNNQQLTSMTSAEVDDAIRLLESELTWLRAQHPGLFDFANAWAERHDAIVAAAPAGLRAEVEQRLHRIGIRWGVAPGARMTSQFPAIK
jgi:hypothetical protein